MELMGSPWQCSVGFLVGKIGIIMILQPAAGVKSGHLETKISSEASEVSVAHIPSRCTPQHNQPQLYCWKRKETQVFMDS